MAKKTARPRVPGAPPSAQPVLVLVGRPNVGKSTLFNRLCRTRRAITSPVPGTTRDWLQGTCHWNGRTFQVIDTGGYQPGDDDVLSAVRAQVEHWVGSADAVIWVVDGLEGATAPDREFGRWLRPLAQRVFVAVNKLDDQRHETGLADFQQFGFKDLVGVSASHGRNVDVLLDRLAEALPTSPVTEVTDEGTARVAIVGRPNVGKSSLLNRLLGEERVIVSDRPGTTRDTVDTLLEWNGRRFLIMDTAGMRTKKSKADELEGLTRIMAEKAIERCEVALLLVDGAEGFMDGDTAVGRMIQDKGRSCVLGVNKWDLVDEKVRAASWFRDRQPAELPFLAYSPLAFLSAKTGQNVAELLETIWDVHYQFHRRWEKGDLEAFFWGEIQNRPYSSDGRKLKFRSAEQVAINPPTFVIRGNLNNDQVHFSYVRHLENVFRERFGVRGTPLEFRFKRGK